MLTAHLHSRVIDLKKPCIRILYRKLRNVDNKGQLIKLFFYQPADGLDDGVIL